MTKNELQIALAAATQTDKRTAGLFLDTLSNLAYKAIKKSGEIVLPGFGKLVKQKRKARTGSIPRRNRRSRFQPRPSSNSESPRRQRMQFQGERNSPVVPFSEEHFSTAVRSRQSEVRILPTMTPILAKVTAIEQRGDHYQVIVQISPKYRGSFNTLAFGETIKPHSGSLKDGRLDLVYHQNPGVTIGDPFPLWTLH